MNSRVVAAIAQKDVIDAIRNRYLLFALLTPLFVALFIRLLLPGMNSMTNVTIVVHDLNQSSLVTKLRAAPQIKLIETDSAEAVGDEVARSNALGGLVVPTNFDAEVAAGKQPELSVYVNNKKNVIELAAFKLLLERQVMSLVQETTPVKLTWIDVAKEAEAKAGRGVNLNQMLLPLLLLLGFGMTGALVVPLLLVEEKEKHTLDFLLTSPARLTEIIMGKALTGVVYSVLIAGVLLALNHRLIGNWPMTLLTILLGLFLVVAIGLLMGSLLKTTMQINTWASFVLLVILAPSFPFPNSPAMLETAMRLIPTYYFVEAMKLSLAGTTSFQIWAHLGLMVACTVISFVAATWALRREQN